ncbi:hypothetical protein GQ42DRAFT_18304 [Ramicandelaber brevisporus]|nr:hypothetical protein GQ42DRAFT_18304 [Ramicandelaber brevisporus]
MLISRVISHNPYLPLPPPLPRSLVLYLVLYQSAIRAATLFSMPPSPLLSMCAHTYTASLLLLIDKRLASFVRCILSSL